MATRGYTYVTSDGRVATARPLWQRVADAPRALVCAVIDVVGLFFGSLCGGVGARSASVVRRPGDRRGGAGGGGGLGGGGGGGGGAPKPPPPPPACGGGGANIRGVSSLRSSLSAAMRGG